MLQHHSALLRCQNETLATILAGNIVAVIEEANDLDEVSARFVVNNPVKEIVSADMHFGTLHRLVFWNGTEVNFSGMTGITVNKDEDEGVLFVNIECRNRRYEMTVEVA